jgi:hypothetical protein
MLLIAKEKDSLRRANDPRLGGPSVALAVRLEHVGGFTSPQRVLLPRRRTGLVARRVADFLRAWPTAVQPSARRERGAVEGMKPDGAIARNPLGQREVRSMEHRHGGTATGLPNRGTAWAALAEQPTLCPFGTWNDVRNIEEAVATRRRGAARMSSSSGWDWLRQVPTRTRSRRRSEASGMHAATGQVHPWGTRTRSGSPAGVVGG